MRLLLSSVVASGLCAVLLIAAACNPEAYNQQANKAAPAAVPGVATAPPAVPAQPPPDNVRRITVDELRQALATQQAVIVDVRNDVAYKGGHIKGALLIPADEIDKHLAELPKDKLIVTYCS